LALPLLLVQARVGGAGVVGVLLPEWQCGGSGPLLITKTATGYSWSMSGTGTCGNSTTDSLSTGSDVSSSLTYSLSGVSSNLGLCTRDALRDLDLRGTASGDAFDLGSITGGDPFPTSGPWSQTLHFAMRTSTFPRLTPFWVYNDAGAMVGNGTVDPGQLGLCPPKGAQHAGISWSEPRPVGPAP
jgi:hypothetical protein